MDVTTLLFIVNKYPRHYHRVLRNRYKPFVDSLDKQYPSKPLKEQLYLYCFPGAYRCYTCGSFGVSFQEFTTGYKKYCSTKCAGSSEAQKLAIAEYLSDPCRVQQKVRKTKKTCLERHGAEFPCGNPAIKDKAVSKMTATYRKKFPTNSVGNRSFKQYNAAVRYYTNKIYQQNKLVLDPHSLRSKEWVLDHIYSVYDGYRNSVPIETLCHPANLRLIAKTQNSSKGPTSIVTLDELYNSITVYNSSKQVL